MFETERDIDCDDMVIIALTPEQEKVKKSIEDLLDRLLLWERHSAEQVEEWLEQLAQQSFALHEQLKLEGQEPAYPAHVLAKRGMGPISKEFYRNMYAAELLLKYIQEGFVPSLREKN